MIEKLARESFESNIGFGFESYQKALTNVKRAASEIYSKLDKIKFFNIHLELTNEKYQEHLKVCTNKENCDTNKEYEAIIYFLGQEMEKLDVKINEDTFSVEEKNTEDNRLDKILKDLEELKFGHQIIYDDLLKEINELKEFYFLGKKKWYQLFAGKFVDMAISGVVSETVSKQIIESLKSEFIKIS